MKADNLFLYANNQKLRSIGWTPRYHLGDGLRQIIARGQQHEKKT